jgi:hypothetical protein
MGLAGAPAGELEYSSPVPAATVQRLACDASVARILLDAESAIVDVGRATRVPAAGTRRALDVKYGGCVWPGCDRRGRWTTAHHIKHWAHGGETSLENLVLLCGRHHWKVHEGGWQLTETDEGFVVLPPVFTALPRGPTGVVA